MSGVDKALSKSLAPHLQHLLVDIRGVCKREDALVDQQLAVAELLDERLSQRAAVCQRASALMLGVDLSIQRRGRRNYCNARAFGHRRALRSSAEALDASQPRCPLAWCSDWVRT